MNTLHIEHPISDYPTWKAAFDRFAHVRKQAGAHHERVRRPIDDEHYIVIDIDFAEAASATRFLTFLQTTVWATPANSPALVGTPDARVLEDVT